MENAYGVQRNRYKRNIPGECKFELITPVHLVKLKHTSLMFYVCSLFARFCISKQLSNGDYERQVFEVWKVASSRIDRMLFIICSLVNLLICAVSSKACVKLYFLLCSGYWTQARNDALSYSVSMTKQQRKEEVVLNYLVCLTYTDKAGVHHG